MTDQKCSIVEFAFKQLIISTTYLYICTDDFCTRVILLFVKTLLSQSFPLLTCQGDKNRLTSFTNHE